MGGYFDRTPLDFNCPGCGRRIRRSIGQIRSNPSFRCPGCSARFEGTNFAQGIKKVEHEIDDLKRRLRRIGR